MGSSLASLIRRYCDSKSGFHVQVGESTILRDPGSDTGGTDREKLCGHNTASCERTGHTKRETCKEKSDTVVSAPEDLRVQQRKESERSSPSGRSIRSTAKFSFLCFPNTERPEGGEVSLTVILPKVGHFFISSQGKLAYCNGSSERCRTCAELRHTATAFG